MAKTLGYGQILATLRVKREQIEEAILVIERLAAGETSGDTPASLSGGKETSSSTTDSPAVKKRRMSAAGRKRIGAATRKRWAAKRSADAAATKTAKRTGRPSKKQS